jgi:hypothetical protein
MSPRKHRWSDSPDFEFIKAQAEHAVAAYCEWLRVVSRDSNAEVSPLLTQVGEALIDLSELIGLSAHIYGEEVGASRNKA